MSKIFISFILFSLIFSITFEFTAFDKNLQKELVEKYSKRENKLEENQQISQFFKTNELNLNMTEKEISHMHDVKRLNDSFVFFIWILLITTGLLIYFYPSLSILTKMWIPLTVLIVILIISLLFPDQLFQVFHKVFFPQGNFTFSYDSFLITLYPAMFFYKLFYHIVLRCIIITVILISIGYLKINFKK